MTRRSGGRNRRGRSGSKRAVVSPCRGRARSLPCVGRSTRGLPLPLERRALARFESFRRRAGAVGRTGGHGLPLAGNRYVNAARLPRGKTERRDRGRSCDGYLRHERRMGGISVERSRPPMPSAWLRQRPLFYCGPATKRLELERGEAGRGRGARRREGDGVGAAEP